MIFYITTVLSFDIYDKFRQKGYSLEVRLQDYLATRLSSNSYGSGVNAFYIGLNCSDPKMLVPPRDFESGFLLTKKYTKSKKELQIEFKLNYERVSKATTEGELLDIISEGFEKTYFEIQALQINDFDISALYADIKNILKNNSWLNESYTEKEFSYKLPTKNYTDLPVYKRMSDDSFWEVY